MKYKTGLFFFIFRLLRRLRLPKSNYFPAYRHRLVRDIAIAYLRKTNKSETLFKLRHYLITDIVELNFFFKLINIIPESITN